MTQQPAEAACLPKAVLDFIFDLYDSVTLSQLSEEQAKLYETDFRDLSQKYFKEQPWPSPQAIASECNGSPLFLAIYRELVHRQFHNIGRPTVRDRIEGFSVYKELFEEILEGEDFYLLPSWCFDLLHEFVYQFQGFCQIKQAVNGAARKQGLINADGSLNTVAAQATTSHHLLENLTALQQSKDAWEVEAVYSYLYKLIDLGMPPKECKPVYSNLNIFASVALSRLECLLCDYSGCLQALTPLAAHDNHVIAKDGGVSVGEILQSVFAARLSLVYHASVSYLMLRRYKDAMSSLSDICSFMQRGFRTGELYKVSGSEQFNKQYDRMLSLLVILTQICPGASIDDNVAKAMREKFGSRLESLSTYEELFQSPKFVSTDPTQAVYRQQVQLFLKEMEPYNIKLRSYLKLYRSLPIEKLAKFHDLSVDEFLPLLLSLKSRMRQLERSSSESYVDGEWKQSLDVHYYIVKDMVHVDEAEKQRRFENYFVAQIEQSNEIRRAVAAIDTEVK
ncbi:hypothetical protein MPSEU_000689900 [Mayamaea pseudoterrestris]|nr:hypothetical protein MPSEU_000689900 [Mayamaea pseudoterrestris]